jgi:tetrahydromethanopterin S-methyltransferase subunit C
MRDETLIIIVGIIAITVLEIVNLLTAKIDGNILSAIVGAIVYILTRKYYKMRSDKNEG